MAFEYNGVVYRDLEPQVRYDAEQIQLLKQADVEINESLQTVNTELNGKLTKPTNPSAESAVTMLADGTVGTKPLSEIGGGGGKLYVHSVSISKTSFGYLHCTIINNTNTQFKSTDLNELFFKKSISTTVDVMSAHKSYIVKYITVSSDSISVEYYTDYPFSSTNSLNFSQNVFTADTVTEL